MKRLTVEDVASLRAASEPLRAGIATYASSDSFKSHYSRMKPASKSMTHHFSTECRNFGGSALKQIAKQAFRFDQIPLGIGRPTSDFYPWESMMLEESFTYPKRSHNDSTQAEADKSARTMAKTGGPFNLTTGLNYSHSVGQQPLLRFITEHIEIIHNPPYQDWNSCLTCGSTSAIEIALRMFCTRGDTVLTEEYTYPGFISTTLLLGLQTLGVDMDTEGLTPEALSRILKTWHHSKGKKPTVLYMIPTGQNPTGATQSLERKRAIYQISEEHDLVIIEDDPYYFLRTECSPISMDQPNNLDPNDSSVVTTYLSSLSSTFLSLDTTGRVVRLDSTSKILAPGLRAGWVTSSAEIIEKFISYQEVGPVAVSGPTQLLLWNLLDATWGHCGFFAWLEHLSRQYRSRLDVILRACDEYLSKDICSWSPPRNGMFVWIRLDTAKHPLFRCHSNIISDEAEIISKKNDIEARIWSKACENGVQVTRGSLFRTPGSSPKAISFRLTYAAAAQDELQEGVSRFANAVHREFQLELS